MPRCPKCGSTKVRSIEDKSKVVAMVGHTPRYKTSFICGSCSHQWSPSEEGSSPS